MPIADDFAAIRAGLQKLEEAKKPKQDQAAKDYFWGYQGDSGDETPVATVYPGSWSDWTACLNWANFKI